MAKRRSALESQPAVTPVRRGLWFVLLSLLALGVFGRTLGFGFLQWDDRLHLLENPHFRPGAGLSELGSFWSGLFGDLYIPVVYSIWGLLRHLLGEGFPALPFRILNLVAHLANALLVFEVLRLMLSRLRSEAGAHALAFASFVGAAIFVVHPLQVESVAWISGFKDLAMGFFSLLAIRACLLRLEIPGWRGFWIPNTLALAAMLCKPAAVVLPLVFIVIDRTFSSRSFRASALRALPGLVASLAVAYLTKRAQPDTEIDSLLPIALRPLVALDALAFYLSKMLVPVGLAIDYGRTPRKIELEGWLYWTWIFPVAVGAVYARLRPRVRGLGLALALVALPFAPVLGFVPFVYQISSTVADRYAYLSLVGLGLLCALVQVRVLSASRGRSPLARPLELLVVVLAVVSFACVAHWRDDRSLFTRTLTVNPGSFVAETQLGRVLMESGQVAEAEVRFRRAHELARGNYAPTLTLLALSLMTQAKHAEVVPLVWPYLAKLPKDVNLRYIVGGSLSGLSRHAEALVVLDEALALQPANAALQNARGVVLMNLGRVDEARKSFGQAVALDPNHAEYRSNLERAGGK